MTRRKTKAEKIREEKIRSYVKESFEVEGDLEIDDDAKLSEGDDNGTYIQMWKWIPFDGTQFCKDGHNCDDYECVKHGGGN